MPAYETTFVLSPILPEADWEARVSKYGGIITTAQGEIKKKEIWGIRKLSYPIKGKSQGYYVHFMYDAPGEVPRELERNFHLDEEVLRYLTVLAPPQPAARPETAVQKGAE